MVDNTIEDGNQVLHWMPDEDRWELIRWADWMNFMQLGDRKAPLKGIASGIHYFIVCINDDGVPFNLIAHKYLIERDGSIGRDNFAGLTKQEREDYGRLMVTSKPTAEDDRRLDEIRKKMGKVYDPPRQSVYALMRILPKRPPEGSLAERFLRHLHCGVD